MVERWVVVESLEEVAVLLLLAVGSCSTVEVECRELERCFDVLLALVLVLVPGQWPTESVLPQGRGSIPHALYP